jgi:hypothetical protein
MSSTAWAVVKWIVAIGLGSALTLALGIAGMGVLMANAMSATTEEAAQRAMWGLGLHAVSFLSLFAAVWLLPLALPWQGKRKVLLVSGGVGVLVGVLLFAAGMAAMFA